MNKRTMMGFDTRCKIRSVKSGRKVVNYSRRLLLQSLEPRASLQCIPKNCVLAIDACRLY